jgi:DNA-binding CsgD family transcriptional regulator
LSDDEADLLLEDLLAVNRPRRPTDTGATETRGEGHQVVVQPLNLGNDRKIQLARLTVHGDDTGATLEVTPFAQALLSPRERQIASAVSLGLHDQQIADNLVLSVHTVKQHLKSIYRKLGVTSRVELTRLVLMRRPPVEGATLSDDDVD